MCWSLALSWGLVRFLAVMICLSLFNSISASVIRLYGLQNTAVTYRIYVVACCQSRRLSMPFGQFRRGRCLFECPSKTRETIVGDLFLALRRKLLTTKGDQNLLDLVAAVLVGRYLLAELIQS